MDMAMDLTHGKSGTAQGDSLRLQVEHALRVCGYPDLSRLRIDCDDGTVTIDGQLKTYYMKQMAQAVAARVPGVLRVENRVGVSMAERSQTAWG